MDRDEKIYTAALNSIFRYNGGPARELIAVAGSAESVFRMNESELRGLFGGREYSFMKEILCKTVLDEAEKELVWAERSGIEILFSTDISGGYPKRLLECEDYPLLIYKRGSSPLEARVVISVVGTRRATINGINICKKIIGDLASSGLNPLIVSGLAFGIDITAHKCALENNLRTIAVLGNSPDTVYPVSHGKYSALIERNGALITEFPRNSLSFKINFIRRNRIIAGMADAVIIAESGEKGGSMITASLAASYDRDVFAIPGRFGDIQSKGCNLLISKNLASLFYSTESFIDQMGWQDLICKKRPEQQILFALESREKEKISVALTSASELNIDEIKRITGIAVPLLSSSLVELELEGKVAALPGKRYSIIQ